MTTDARVVLNARIAELLHAAFVRIRNGTYPAIPEDGQPLDELNDLADLVHNLPRYIVGHDEHALESMEQLRGAVIHHVRRFYPTIDPLQHRYVWLLDLDDETFLARYRDHDWNYPEPEPAAQH